MILLVITTLCLTQIQGLEESYSYEDSSNIGNFGKMQMQYPWLAMILDENIPICSGSIISDEVILTSAKCTVKSMASLNVWVGSSPVGREGGSRHGIKGIRRYEEYHVFGFNVSSSIALMKVSPHFDFNERVNKVLLPNNMDFIAPYRGAIVNSWMIKASEKMKDRYDYFMEVGSLLVSPDRQCSHIFGLSKSPGFFCATLQNRELSLVDFGGPVVADGVQIGIVPFKFYGKIYQAPELYIDVGFYREWIDKKLLVL